MKKYLIGLALMLSSFSLLAQEARIVPGEIVSFSETSISFDDQHFVLSPTVKIWESKNKRGSFFMLKKGDFVALKMFKIGNKYLVDHIYLNTSDL